MHYGIYLFLALLGIFHPIKTERNIVDGRQYRCKLSLRSVVSEDRPYVVKDYSKFSPELVVIQRNQRSQYPSRFRERDSRIIQRNIREKRQSRTNNDQSMYIRNVDRNEPDRINRDWQNKGERYSLVPRTKQVDKPAQRAYLRSALARKVNLRNIDRTRDHNTRSRSLDRMRQNERRISRQRSLERSISPGGHENYRIINLNLENMPSRDRNNEIRHQIAARSNAAVSQSYRVDLSRNRLNNQYRDGLTRERQFDERRNNINKRSVLLEHDSRRLTENSRIGTHEPSLSQRNALRKERSFILQQREKFVEMERQELRSRRVASRSIERIELRSASSNFEDKRSTILRRERTSLRDAYNSQQLRERHSTIRIETRTHSAHARHMERDLIEHHVRGNNAQSYRRDDARRSEMQNKVLTSERMNQERDNHGMNRERFSRYELVRSSIPRDRRISRENAEHILRYDSSRKVLNSFKNNDVTITSHWQILIYSLQGIYLCSMLIEMFTKTESSLKKPRSYRWLTVIHPMKTD